MSSLGRSAAGKRSAFVILGVIVVAAFVWLIYEHGNANRPAKPTDKWETVTLSSEKIHFKVPESWTTGDNDTGDDTDQPPQSVSFIAPPTNNYYFSLEISVGGTEDIYKSFLGNNEGLAILRLPATGSKQPLYLVAQGNKQTVTGLALASTPGSDKTSFGIKDPDGKGDHNVTMSVNLVTSPPSAIPPPFTLKMYQSQPEYRDVLGIFNSLYFSN